MGVVCASCGETNRDGARFCAACGARTLARCITCDADLAEGSRFCDSCGAPVLAAQPASDDEVGTQTRKVVTVLFGDLVGSTALQERMDPESVRSLMGRCYSVLRDCVERRGGRVVKFVGDGTMAVFGVPEVAQDDAARALAAGADMVSAIDGLGAALKLRVGINTGEVVVDEDDPDIVGDVVNVAARLEGAAPPGTVLVSDATWRLTRHGARFAAAELVPIRGRTDPVVAHPLVAVGVEGQEAASVSFVGREQELGLLLGALDAAVADATLRMVTVIGSPGLGKSRLGRELDARAADRATTVCVECLPDGGSAIGPIAELLEALADAGPVEDEHERVATVRQELAAGEATPPEELFWAVRRSVEAAAANRPLVLLIEDLHWAEPLVLDLVEHLAEWVRSEPVLLVAVARPELRELRPSLATPRGAGQQVLTLEGLDGAATEALARELLDADDVPAELIAKVGAATEGNPLFVRELIHMLVDDGVLERSDAGWVLTVAAETIDVPPTIQALLAARIDQLGESERTVLERAAVVGAEVYRGALEALVPADVASRLDEVLEGLRRKELLEPSGTYWIDERVLRFHHALIRDAAYARLLRGTRARLHERTARWIDDKTAGSPEHDEAVGYHLEQAQASYRALGPLDDDGHAVATEAATRLSSAATRALERDDLPAAANLAERAVACLDTADAMRGDLLIVQSEALLGDGRVVEAGPVIEELTSLGQLDPRLAAWAACFEVQRTTLTTADGLDDAAAQLVVVAEQLAQLGDQVGAAKGHRVHASVLARLGQVAATEAALDRALSAARAAGNRRQITSVLTAAPQAALAGPSPVPRAGGRCLDVVRLVRITTGARVVESVSIRCQAILEAMRGRFEAARTMLESARHIAEELGSTNGLLDNDLSAGIVELYAGRPADAAPLLERAQEGFATLGVGADAARAAALRARATMELGHDDEALALVEESERLGSQDLRSNITRRSVQAQVLARRGASADAVRLAQEAVAIAERTDALVDHGDACAALSVVLHLAGDVAGAERAAAKAHALYERKGAAALIDLLGRGQGRPAGTTTAGQATPDIPPVANATSRAYLRTLELIAAHRVDELTPYVSPDIVVTDMREGMGDRVEGRDATIEMLRITAALGVTHIDPTVLAVRGERLALVAMTWRGDDSYELPLVAVVRTREDGLIDDLVNYGPEALPDAIAMLNESFVAGEGAPYAHGLRLMGRIFDAYRHHDWDRIVDVYSPDVVSVDHRPGATMTTSGREAMLERHRTMADIAPDYLLMPRRLIELTETAALSDTVSLASTPDGSGYGIARLILSTVEAPAGPVTRFEYFDLDQLPLALARFHELAQASTEQENDASRLQQRTFQAMVARDWDGVRAMFSEGITAQDRRPGMTSLLVGPDEVTGSLQSLADLGVERVDLQPVEVRGDRLVLTHTHWIGAQFEAQALFIIETDADGHCVASVCFEPEQVDEARAELDARARELDRSTSRSMEEASRSTIAGAPSDVRGTSHAERGHAPVEEPTNLALRTQRELIDAMVARNFDAVRRLLSPACVSEDLRPGFLVRLDGAEATIENFRNIVDLGVERVDLVPLLLRGERLSLAWSVWAGAGGYTIDILTLSEMDDDGFICQRINWEPEQLDEAIIELERRFHAGEGTDDPAWIRVVSPHLELAHGRRDWAALSAFYSPDVQMRDHRPLGAGAIRGVDAAVHYQQAMVELDPTHRFLTRRRFALGDHVGFSEQLSIGTSSALDGGPTERTTVVVTTHDDASRLCSFELFEPTDLPAAHARFDQLAAQGHPQTMAERNVRRTEEALLARDLEALEALYAPDAAGDDRRSVMGIGVSDRATIFQVFDYVLHEWGGLQEVDNQVIGRDGEHAVAVRTAWRGAGLEIQFCLVARVNDVGQCTQLVFFDADKEAEALAELRIDAPAHEAALGEPTNPAYRAQQALLEAILAADYTAARHLLADGCVSEDLRPGVRSYLDSADTTVANFRSLTDLGVAQVDMAPVMLRGERLALARTRWVNHAGFTVDVLSLCELDGDGRFCHRVNWALDQLDEAVEATNAAYFTGEGAPFAAWMAAPTAAIVAHVRRDWEMLRGLYTDDVVLRDHRRMAQATLTGPDEAVTYVRTMVDIDPTHVQILRRHLEMGDHVALHELVSTGTGSDMEHGSTEMVTLLVSAHTDDGQTTSMDRYNVEDLAAARARFDELVSQRHPPTASRRNARHIEEAAPARDLDE